jgi:hypothetical protein
LRQLKSDNFKEFENVIKLRDSDRWRPGPKPLPGPELCSPKSLESLMERMKKFKPKLRQISLRASVSLDRLPFALPPAGLSRLVLLLDDYSARSIP